MKKLRRVFLLVLMLSLAILTACNNKCRPSNEWEFDEEKHWHECIDCTEILDVANHQLTWNVKTIATCEVALVEEGACVCGYTTTKTGSKSGHYLKDLDGIDATCTESGLTEGKKCSICDEIIVKQEVIKALGHDEETIPGKAATCTEPGLTEGKKCNVCDEIIVKQEVIKALGHDEETLPGKAPTCTEHGLTEGKKCSVCNEIIIKQEEIKALGHVEEILPRVEATCTESGLTEGKKCSICKETLVEQEEIKALGHDITHSYFEEQDGVMMFIGLCSRCGLIETEVDTTNPIEVDNYNDLLTILNAGYHAILTESVDLPTAIVISKDVTVTINSGVVITLTNDTNGEGAFRVIDDATLTINGQGIINGVGNNDYNMAIWADGGHVVINGGTYTNEGATGEGADHFDLIYVKNGGSVTINGGTFKAQTPKWTLNIHDSTGGVFTVNGGTFKGYDPANSQTEPAGANNNFVAEGYISLLSGDSYKVVKLTSIPEAISVASKAGSSYTKEKYYLVGTVTNVYNTTFGNMYLKDADGKQICIYGLYADNGSTRYDKMSYKPVEGDVVIVCGVLGTYNTTSQMKDGWLISCTPHEHVYAEATCTAAKTCTICKVTDGGTLPHIDVEKDHECDECGAMTGTHEDIGGDSLCDYCNGEYTGAVIGTLAEFTFGANGTAFHADGNAYGSTKQYTSGDYTLSLTNMSKVYGPAYDAKGNSCIKLGTGDVVGSLQFTIDENVTEVVIYVAKYKSNATSVTINGKAYTLTKASNSGEYDVITIDTTTTKTITFKSGTSGDKRCMINTIILNGYAE